MPNRIDNHLGIAFGEITIQNAINQIKEDIEQAIVNGGTRAKNALIRTQKPIKLIHDALKTSLVRNGVHESLINPDHTRLLKQLVPNRRNIARAVRLKDKEQNLAGFFMKKYQDISVIPNNISINPAGLTMPTFLYGEQDIYGELFTESVLSINVRSQLSSTDKNRGTLYERTIAEALNFHRRLPKMVLSEVYMISVKEYDETAAQQNRVGFKHADNIEKYIKAFQAINSRTNENDELYKYERCCLLIVDFDRPIPKIYNSNAELVADGFLPANSIASMAGLDYQNFITDILRIYTVRFPANTFN